MTIETKKCKKTMATFIETKFAVEDAVFFMHSNKVCEGTIKKITITIESSIEIRYKIAIKGTFNTKSLLEDKIFSSKKELLNTL